MKTYTVVVHCRQRGAIGIFYDRTFTLTDLEGLGRDQLRDRWFDRFGAEWELHHVVAVIESAGGSVEGA